MNTLKGFLLLALAVIVYGCGSGEPSAEEQRKEISLFEGILYSPESSLDRDSALMLVDRYLQYGEAFPEDSLSPHYQFKAARMHMALDNHQEALTLLRQLEARYPDWEMMPQVLIIRGTIYDDHLHDYNNAQKAYQRIIDEYPGDELVPDARALIMHLGKSPEDIIREFEEKAAEADTALAS